MATTTKIMVGIDDQVIELSGADKEALLKDRAEIQLLEAEYKAKQDARTAAITKLGQASGLTEEEINSILGL